MVRNGKETGFVIGQKGTNIVMNILEHKAYTQKNKIFLIDLGQAKRVLSNEIAREYFFTRRGRPRARIDHDIQIENVKLGQQSFQIETLESVKLWQLFVLASNEIIFLAITHSLPYEYITRVNYIALFTCSIIELSHKNISKRKR